MSKKIRYAGEVFSGYNKPKKTPGESKKFAVLVKDKNGNDKIVRFGDPKMGHHKGGHMVMPSVEGHNWQERQDNPGLLVPGAGNEVCC